MERQIQRDAWGSAHTARVAHTNCLQMMQKKRQPPKSRTFEPSAGIISGERCAKLFCYPKPNTVSELKVALEKTRENFPKNKAVSSFGKGSEST